jgi:hypothetical protein
MKTYRDGGIATPFSISALDGVIGQLHAPAVLTPGKEPPARYSLGREAGCIQEPIWTLQRRYFLFLLGIDVAYHLCRFDTGLSRRV